MEVRRRAASAQMADAPEDVGTDEDSGVADALEALGTSDATGVAGVVDVPGVGDEAAPHAATTTLKTSTGARR